MEDRILNDATRQELGGTFVELHYGWTHYELGGEEGAPVIVLVHGNAVPLATWDRTIPALQDAGFRTLRYDIYGNGYSDRPRLRAYHRTLYDRQLTELLSVLKITSPVFMAGTSQGGSIAAYYAANHPGNVKRLALLAPLFDDYSGKSMAGLLRGPLGGFMMKMAGERSLTDPSRGLATDRFLEELTDKLKSQIEYEGKTRAVLANIRGDSFANPVVPYEEVKRQGIPVLLTLAEYDGSIPRESMERLRQLIPEIEFHFIRNAAHLAITNLQRR